VSLSFNLLTNFSIIPLQCVSFGGILVAVLGLFFAIFYLGQSLFSNIAVPGYASLIIAILVLGGTQLLALGVLGEYIGRLHLNVNRKPQYVEREVLGRHRTSPSNGLRARNFSSEEYSPKTVLL